MHHDGRIDAETLLADPDFMDGLAALYLAFGKRWAEDGGGCDAVSLVTGVAGFGMTRFLIAAAPVNTTSEDHLRDCERAFYKAASLRDGTLTGDHAR